jgi:hypothetical protein
MKHLPVPRQFVSLRAIRAPDSWLLTSDFCFHPCSSASICGSPSVSGRPVPGPSCFPHFFSDLIRLNPTHEHHAQR